jgi:hypothetical protein
LKGQIQNKAEKYELLEEQQGEISKNLKDAKKGLKTKKEEHMSLLGRALNKPLDIAFTTFTIFF